MRGEQADRTWLQRAKEAHGRRELPEFISDAIGTFFHVVLLVAAGFGVISVGVQGIIELVGWLRDAVWHNYDWYWYFGVPEGANLWETEFKGLNFLISEALNSWITAPFGVVGFAILVMQDKS